MKRTRHALWAAILFSLIGCRDDDDTGRLSMGVTDAPVDGASAVVVEFTGVEVKPARGEALDFSFDEPRRIDLLALAGGGSELLLDDVLVPAGQYEWVRLKVNAEDDGVLDSFIALKDDSEHELFVPSGSQSGLKLVSGFVVPAGGSAEFTIDFDLRKSVHEPMNAADSYTLRPALRIVDNARVGTIAGRVDEALVVDGCSPAVYVFSGTGAEADDVDGADAEPVTTAIVHHDDTGGLWTYRAEFIAEGPYTVAFTCDAAADEPDSSETLSFAGAQDASVSAGQVTEVNFAAPF
jgi:hypothetical protein